MALLVCRLHLILYAVGSTATVMLVGIGLWRG
jgi:hypothetical protein